MIDGNRWYIMMIKIERYRQVIDTEIMMMKVDRQVDILYVDNRCIDKLLDVKIQRK